MHPQKFYFPQPKYDDLEVGSISPSTGTSHLQALLLLSYLRLGHKEFLAQTPHRIHRGIDALPLHL